MMVSRDGALGMLIGVVVGTLFLVPTHGSAQDTPSVSCGDIDFRSPLSDVLLCALREDAFAQHVLGLWYDTGDYGLAEDNEEAVLWYRLSAEQGDARGQSALGRMYARGEGLAEDDEEAVRWYRLAAEQGYAGAQYNLGRMYTEGEGVPEDDEEAVWWYSLAAEQGHAAAQYNLGLMYSYGEGVPEDLVLAYMWYNLSAAQGNSRGRWDKIVLEHRLAREEIAEAQRLSREWIETHPRDGGT